MPFYLSPSVNVIEQDLTTIVPAVATSIGASVGVFPWGPVMTPVTITSENELVRVFGKPNNNVSNFTSFFTAANFLSYSNNILMVRADLADLLNAVAAPDEGSGEGIKIKNPDHYLEQFANGEASVGPFAAKYPGALGNSLKVSMADGDTFSAWAYKDGFSAPSVTSYGAALDALKDEVHVVVIDEDGAFTGVKGSILERFSGLSKASDAVKYDGSNNYYKDVINNTSKYVYWMDHPVTGTLPANNWGQPASNVSFQALTSGTQSYSLAGGADAWNVTDGELMTAYSLFANSELVDVSLVMCGKASDVVAEHVLVNVAEIRRDCVAFMSPQNLTTGEVIIGDDSDAKDKLIAFRNALPSSSYGFLDSGYKYQYDRYNDKYRWIPLNGDIAGLFARTDYTNDPWWTASGYNRGIIKNVVKLAVNPNKAIRDIIFPAGINPVINSPGDGPVLLGDKTLQSKPSAFDAINVRRLFIVLEKAIATASKYSLFEFNDSFTRAQFKNMVEPFLRGVMGRRGITDFRVKCDETNNTGEVIDSNQFIADIYIKPARAIRYIQLSFIAVRTGVSFDEIGG